MGSPHDRETPTLARCATAGPRAIVLLDAPLAALSRRFDSIVLALCRFSATSALAFIANRSDRWRNNHAQRPDFETRARYRDESCALHGNTAQLNLPY